MFHSSVPNSVLWILFSLQPAGWRNYLWTQTGWQYGSSNNIPSTAILRFRVLNVNTPVLKSKNPDSLIQLFIVTEGHVTIHIRITTQKKKSFTFYTKHAMFTAVLHQQPSLDIQSSVSAILYEKYEGFFFSKLHHIYHRSHSAVTSIICGINKCYTRMKPIRRHNLMHPHKQHFKHCCTNLCVRNHSFQNLEPQKMPVFEAQHTRAIFTIHWLWLQTQAKCLTRKKLDVANNTLNGPLDSVAAGRV